MVLKTSLSKKNGGQGLPGFLVSHLMISKRGDSLASESPLQTTYWNINWIIYDCKWLFWMFPKLVGFPAKSSIFKKRSFPLCSPSILGENPYFWKTPQISVRIPRLGVPHLQRRALEQPKVPLPRSSSTGWCGVLSGHNVGSSRSNP